MAGDEIMELVTGTTWNIIKTLFLISFVIFVHEIGHFITAKRFKIKVERFSIGFGPKLVGFKRGETEYVISWLPIFGGYVKMAGENPAERKEEEIDTDLKGQFYSAPVYQRALIAISGPAMNVLFAIVAISFAYMLGMPPRSGTEVGYVKPNSPAEKAGIKPGDKILSIAGYKVRKWDDISENIGINAGKEIDIKLMRNGETITLFATPERMGDVDIGRIGISPPLEPIIGQVAPDSDANKAGFREGDQIVAVNGDKIGHILELLDEIETSRPQDNKVNLTIIRDGNRMELPLKVEFDASGNLTSLGGISFGKIVRLNPISAFGVGTFETFQIGGKVFQFLKRLILRDIPVKYVSGPVGIVQITMSAVRTGISGILWFAGFLSVNLGVINLLPIFITDGGVLLFLVIEKLRGKPMTVKRQILVQQIGLGVIITLFLLVTYNDVLRLIRGSL